MLVGLYWDCNLLLTQWELQQKHAVWRNQQAEELRADTSVMGTLNTPANEARN
jgi:hypothetical protein